MIDYKTYRTSNGYVTVERQRQRTRDTEYKDVIYSSIGRPRVVTYDEYSFDRLVYLVNILVGFEGKNK